MGVRVCVKETERQELIERERKKERETKTESERQRQRERGFSKNSGRELTFLRNLLQDEGREWNQETQHGPGLGSWDT